MIRSFTIQLLNIFSKISFYTLYSNRSQVIVEMNLFSYHAFTFYKRLTIFFTTNFSNGFLRLCYIFGPDYFGATRCDNRFKKLQLFIQGSNCFPFCILCFFTSQFNIHELLFPLWDHRIVLTNIKIDLTTMFPVCSLDRATR